MVQKLVRLARQLTHKQIRLISAMVKFNNTYTTLPDHFYERVMPEKFDSAKLITFNHDLASELGMELENYSDQELAIFFSGQELLKGSDPIAQAYAGYQFGQPSPQLGDGRAHLLGEVSGFDIQLKGSGRTSFSRRGDGRSALGPVLREYIVSEAMHTLGVPTTRALSAVETNEVVHRQFGPEPGGIFTRVASSHIRVGTFQYFQFRDDLKSIEQLLNYTVNRHYPELNELSLKEKSLALIKKLIEKQSDLIAQWSALGFIHGVMNTDNFSVAGITIDYGPCAFMDEFKFHKVFSSIDQNGRYSFYNQAPIAQWNILRLADCLIPFIHESSVKAVKIVEQELSGPMNLFAEKRNQAFLTKLGIKNFEKEDELLINNFLNYLEQEHLDFTLAFRHLPNLFDGETDFYPSHKLLDSFLGAWKERVDCVDVLNTINPLYIPRNHQIEKAIQLAYNGDYAHFFKLHQVLRDPFSEQAGASTFALAPLKEERVYQTFCGT